MFIPSVKVQYMKNKCLSAIQSYQVTLPPLSCLILNFHLVINSEF